MTWVTFNIGKFLIIFINMSNYYSSRAHEFTPGFFLVGSVLLIFVVLGVLLCFCTFWVSCCAVSYDFRIKRCSVRLYLQVFVWGLMSYLHYLCLFEYSDVQQILCCVFVLFVFFLSCVPYVTSFSGLSSWLSLPYSYYLTLTMIIKIYFIHAIIEPKAPIFRINHTIITNFYYIHVRGILIFSREINTEVWYSTINSITTLTFRRSKQKLPVSKQHNTTCILLKM